MPKVKIKVSRKMKVGKATLIEKDLFINGVYEDSVCTVKIGRAEVGGYTSINDALAHKGEWSDVND